MRYISAGHTTVGTVTLNFLSNHGCAPTQIMSKHSRGLRERICCCCYRHVTSEKERWSTDEGSGCHPCRVCFSRSGGCGQDLLPCFQLEGCASPSASISPPAAAPNTKHWSGCDVRRMPDLLNVKARWPLAYSRSLLCRLSSSRNRLLPL